MAPPQKRYGDATYYERKLQTVSQRLKVDKGSLSFDWGRSGAHVTFRFKGQDYRFEHTLEKAAKLGRPLYYGSDCFALIVLTMESLARMAENGFTEDLRPWIEGFKALPAGSLPDFFVKLGLDHLPSSEELTQRWRSLVRKVHPDAGGSPELFHEVQVAYAQAQQYISGAVAAKP